MDTETFGGDAAAFAVLMGRTVGFAVRRAWPDGTHDLFGFSRRAGRVQRRLGRDVRRWRRGPVWPVHREMVRLSLDAFRNHRRWCIDPVCAGVVVADPSSAVR